MSELLELPLQVQLSLGLGYCAYIVAYSGLTAHHRARDAVFISFAFGAISLLTYSSANEEWGQWTSAAITIAVALFAASCWRKFGRRLVYWLLGKLKIHNDDGHSDCWQSLIQTPNLVVGQIAVYTTDGRTLWMNKREPYFNGPKGGLELGSDGSILMVVEEETLPDGEEIQKEDIVHDSWGTRLTFIPSGSITRVNLRVK
ncbi:hypothetical protein [Terasakiella pusilla]|uniref:hypothetical protein n=1 Tax=Terasakiella pusilla TaxID=64973 RepID=UPI003AA9D0CA